MLVPTVSKGDNSDELGAIGHAMAAAGALEATVTPDVPHGLQPPTSASQTRTAHSTT